LGEHPDKIWASSIGADTTVAVIGNGFLQHGVLVTTAGGVPRISPPPAYEEQYFEGEVDSLGYGKYLEQYDWRMEKSRRLIRQIKGVAYYLGKPLEEGIRLLDVGSAYGYFRKAASECRWKHDGLDVSRHAARISEKLFGFSTNVVTLEEFCAQEASRYDIITLFDAVEHVEDPQCLLGCAADLLTDGGLCVIRTPNILALEFEVLGPYYHSLTRAHLHYFSPKSLCHCLQSAGLTPVLITTESHLLQGFLGRELATYARLLRGSDILAIAQKEVATRP
jgi:2-polyprenyl-3-methyl-5-hydroxy-6-metoxy-1,4-benzoquinol methylase